MSSADVAYVTPKVLRWAIERRRMRLDKLAESLKIKPELLESWQDGSAHPTFSKAQKLAATLRVPFGVLFMTSPPVLKVPLPDFRTRARRLREPSVDFMDLLNGVIVKQDWYREHAIAENAPECKFVGRYSVEHAVNVVAADIRQTLGINESLRSIAGSWEKYLRLLCICAETAGILVMRSGVVGNDTQRPLNVDEFQGFTIADKRAPVIFINGKDHKNAQIFTLAHELAHLWIGASGISTPDEGIETAQDATETYCNAVAAEVLVPAVLFRDAWPDRNPEEAVLKLATRFRVSGIVILRRALDLDFVDRSEFQRLLKIEKSRVRAAKAAGGGNFYINLTARHGDRFTNAVVSELKSGTTGYRDAARLLDVKVPTLVNFLTREA